METLIKHKTDEIKWGNDVAAIRKCWCVCVSAYVCRPLCCCVYVCVCVFIK